ncbi:MAG: TonB-dependent receptor [Bacteroidales bacterium]|nr:TonB-dependent receptor [Bacteroidales bacterium]
MKRLSRALALTVLLSTITFPAAAQASLQDTLQEVVITATGTHHVLKDVPVQTEVITSRMLQNFAGRSLEDILGSLTASFAFNEDDMGSHIQMNGLGNSYILILIDGKRIHGDVGGENDLSLIDPNNIEKIEIVKGASSALYGSDAIAGVINVITRKHREEGLLLENVSRFGSYVDIRQHNAVGIHYGRFTSMTNFQLQHSDGWQNTPVEHTAAGEDPVTDSQNKTVNRHTNWQVAERLVYEPDKNLEMYAQGSIYGKRIYRPNGKYPRYDVHTYDLTYSNASASLGAKWKIGAYDGVTFDLDWNRHAYLYYFTAMTLVEDYEKSAGTIYYPYFPYLAGQSELESDQQRTMAALKGVFTLEGGHRLNTGAEYRYDWLHAPNRVAGKTASDHTAATYVQDEWKHDFGRASQIQLAGGLRLTWNRQFGLHLTPKISAMLGLGEPWRLRATWSRGFKTPTPKELYYCYVRQMGGTYLYIGKGDLRPQSSDFFSFGGEYTAGGLSITATAYYNYVRDMIALVTIPNYLAPDEYIARYDPIRTRQYQNIEDARTRGVDVNVRYTLKEWAFGLGYSWLDTDANQYDSEHDRMHEVIIDGTAHHKGNCFVTWNHKSAKGTRWGSGLYGRMSSTRYYQLDGNGKGYNLWRLTGSCEPALKGRTSLRLEAGIDNIFDYVDRTPHGLHLGTTTPGRTIYGSITIRFNSGKSLKKYKTNIINSNHSKQNEED